jgi:molecular chaperone GrpE
MELIAYERKYAADKRPRFNVMTNGDTNAGDADSGGSTAERPTEAQPAAAAPELTPAAADERMAALVAERDETRDRMLRIAADCDNWMKRARKEQADAVRGAKADVLREMLEVVDGLERALEARTPVADLGDGTAVQKGVDLVLRSLLHKLERQGVTPIEAAGRPFDPHLHEAISRVDAADVPAGSVAAELQRGYRFGDRLLRPARVAVSAGAGGPPRPAASG